MKFQTSNHSDKHPPEHTKKTPPADRKKKEEDEHEEEILDEGIEESFPASDPPSTSVPGSGISRP